MAHHIYTNTARPVPSRHQDRYPPQDDDGYADGSMYIDLTSRHADLYGPKADGKWPKKSVSLINPDGSNAASFFERAQNHINPELKLR